MHVTVDLDIDIPLLREQKRWVLEQARARPVEPCIEGLIGLLDAIGDIIVDSGLAAERDVFPMDAKDCHSPSPSEAALDEINDVLDSTENWCADTFDRIVQILEESGRRISTPESDED